MDEGQATGLICHLEDITEDSVVRFMSTGCDFIVIRREGRLYGYRNECPHMNLPLTNRHNYKIDKKQKHLVCTQHAAEFAIENGLCVRGPCKGMKLEPVIIDLSDGKVYLKG